MSTLNEEAYGDGYEEKNIAVQNKNSKLMIKLVIVAVVMLLFGTLVLPPLYNLACQLTGNNISPDNGSTIVAGQLHKGPTGNKDLRVSFQTRILDDLPVRFYVNKKETTIKAGQIGFNSFVLENLSDKTVYLRPIHTVSPSFAAASFDMMVCFCFNDQALKPFEKKNFDIQYTFAADMDERVNRAMVRYDLHKIEAKRMRPVQIGPEALDPETIKKIIRSQADE